MITCGPLTFIHPEDELPDDEEAVLCVWLDDGDLDTGFYDSDSECFRSRGSASKFKPQPDAWARFPEVEKVTGKVKVP